MATPLRSMFTPRDMRSVCSGSTGARWVICCPALSRNTAVLLIRPSIEFRFLNRDGVL